MATDWSRLTVVDLRQELKRRGLPQTGKKADLVERLATADTEEDSARETSNTLTPQPDEKEHESTPAKKSPEFQPTLTSKLEHVEATEVAKELSASTPSAESAPEDKRDTEDASKPTTAHVPSTAATTLKSEVVSDTKVGDVADEKMEDPVSAEPDSTAPELSPDLSKDIRGRKRRSRSPPPSDDESSRKRTRPSDENETENGAPIHAITVKSPRGEVMPLQDDLTGNDVSYAKIHPDIPETQHESNQQGDPDEDDQMDSAGTKENGAQAQEENNLFTEDRDRDTHRADTYERRPSTNDDRMDVTTGDLSPAEHPATTALYIKNFMRPLKAPMLREYLEDIATPPGKTPDPNIIEEFFLDQIRTHAFVRFSSVSAAARVRVSLHGKVWPQESNRKELWVDFIPPDKVEEWSATENAEGPRGGLSRWEVRYEEDQDGRIMAKLVNAAAAGPPPRQPAARPQAPPSAVNIPTGPRQYPGIEAAPSGPRGRGNTRDMRGFQDTEGMKRTTCAGPVIYYKPVSAELAQRRLENMRSYYTRDRHRDLGRPDEINRYTFEDGDQFVDRGKEVFVGIRPPHRENERRRGGGGYGGGYGGGNGDWGRHRGGPPFRGPRGGDRYYGGSRNEPPPPSRRDDVPRSRFDGAPLPTYGGGGGGGFRSDQRGGGGGRRDNFRNNRY
ncbi:hypothetical protein B0H66DRAFT_246336 [Apodospora peruviana]|uniref:SAP domain-containing protein n=1 Tax=Apodospora peruviana TaxID=516989 RepID=A0AAE0M4E4_9PEZI|nr:hypothetical protein B0H66DRAFT_246336 [Apodospora peruviana]